MSNAEMIINKSRNAFDGQAGHYDISRDGEHARRIYNDVIKTVNRFNHGCILDVGFGTGAILGRICEDTRVAASGIDLSQNMLNVAKQRLGERVDLRCGDSEHLPWNDGCFDMVICTDSFHHYPRPLAVLSEMKRVLKPTGKIIIADVWLPSPFREIANLLMPLSRDGDLKIYSEKAMMNLLKISSLRCLSWEQSGGTAFIMVCDKNDEDYMIKQ